MDFDLLPLMASVLTFPGIGLMAVGVLIGLLGGALPGISASVSIALILPMTYSLEPAAALFLLGAIYMAAEFGGSISAILLNTPGTPAAICTSLDGYPLAQKGRAREAIALAVVASTVGGLIGATALLLFTPSLAALSLQFGASETFWLGIAGLATVCSLAADSFAKGVAMAAFGLWLSTVGIDPNSGYARFTFGVMKAEAGVHLVPAILGFFAVAQMLHLVVDNKTTIAPDDDRRPGIRAAFSGILGRPLLTLRSAAIGIGVGILPGAGASIASYLSYNEAKRAADDPDQFGQGEPAGIIAAETANNAMVGGSLVPLLALGIPGSASAAILYGSLTINNIIPGPRLFSEHGDLAYQFILALFPICLLMGAAGLLLTPVYATLLRIKVKHIVPTVLLLAVVGSFYVRNSIFDVYVTAACGATGFLLNRTGYSVGPLVLGLVLGPLIEESFRRALLLGNVQGSVWLYFFGRPLSLGLIAITGLIVASAFSSRRRRALAALRQ